MRDGLRAVARFEYYRPDQFFNDLRIIQIDLAILGDSAACASSVRPCAFGDLKQAYALALGIHDVKMIAIRPHSGRMAEVLVLN